MKQANTEWSLGPGKPVLCGGGASERHGSREGCREERASCHRVTFSSHFPCKMAPVCRWRKMGFARHMLTVEAQPALPREAVLWGKDFAGGRASQGDVRGPSDPRVWPREQRKKASCARRFWELQERTAARRPFSSFFPALLTLCCQRPSCHPDAAGRPQ